MICGPVRLFRKGDIVTSEEIDKTALNKVYISKLRMLVGASKHCKLMKVSPVDSEIEEVELYRKEDDTSINNDYFYFLKQMLNN